MRKALFFLALSGAFLTQSCQKMALDAVNSVAKTESATLKTGDTYTYVLPTDIGDDPFSITQQATGFSVSELTTDANGAGIYQYTPKTGFTGTDVVIISNEHERQGGCMAHDSIPHDSLGAPHPHHPHFGPHPRKGRPKVEEHTHYTITINLTVENGEVKRITTPTTAQ